MDIHDTDLARLSLLIERILDADVLNDSDGAPLLTATEAARRCLEVGDVEEAHQHVNQVALVTEALLQTDALDLARGRAVLETARRILSGETD